MQRGNSSTFARFRPRSKIRIFGSGTPRLNRDLGYGYEDIQSVFGHLKVPRYVQNENHPLPAVGTFSMTRVATESRCLCSAPKSLVPSRKESYRPCSCSNGNTSLDGVPS